MIKKIIFLFTICVLLVFFTFTGVCSSNDEKPEYIKIGLKSLLLSNNCVDVESESGFEIVRMDNEFNRIISLDIKKLKIRVSDFYSYEDSEYIKQENINNSSTGPFFIQLNEKFDSYKEIMSKIKAFKEDNIQIYPFYDNGKFKIVLGQFTNKNKAYTKACDIQTKLGCSFQIFNGYGDKLIIEDELKNIILMYDSSQNLFLKSIGKTNTKIKVENNRYRDYIIFNIINNKILPINYVTINHYLYGVVPREVSANWPLEALKAQAVAARNYALDNLGRYKENGYDLCDTQNSQVYAGYDWENTKTNKAVDETSDVIVTYCGEIVPLYYHSSSGGHTEDSQNIWSYEIPYIKGIKDEYSCDSPYDNWQFVISKDKIMDKLLSNDKNIGRIVYVNILETSDNNRVTKLKIEGTKDSIVLEKEEIRKILGYSNIKSTWFSISTDCDLFVLNGEGQQARKTINNYNVVTKEGLKNIEKHSSSNISVKNSMDILTINIIPHTYTFKGKGWGHGLGMSQWGAKRMAEIGYDFIKILKYYYTGITIE